VRAAIVRLQSVLPRIFELAIGGTAVGTGLNTDPRFSPSVIERLSAATGLGFRAAANSFSGIGAQDAALDMSAQMLQKTRDRRAG
jgi:fumarate hydratase, class II